MGLNLKKRKFKKIFYLNIQNILELIGRFHLEKAKEEKRTSGYLLQTLSTSGDVDHS
jgi:hypothetical protein